MTPKRHFEINRPLNVPDLSEDQNSHFEKISSLIVSNFKILCSDYLAIQNWIDFHALIQLEKLAFKNDLCLTASRYQWTKKVQVSLKENKLSNSLIAKTFEKTVIPSKQDIKSWKFPKIIFITSKFIPVR